jgi:uncharacterized protein (TIGR03435 family)
MRVSVLFLVCFCAGAQTTDKPQFEAASVKPSPPAKTVMAGLPGGHVDAENISFRNFPLQMLIQNAYDIQTQNLVGPSWLSSVDYTGTKDKFDLDLKIAKGATPEQQRLMMQNLLEERFGLKAHREKREAPVFFLTVAKGGIKMTESAALPEGTPAPEYRRGPNGEDGFPTMPLGFSGFFANSTPSGRIHAKFMRRSMEEFVKWCTAYGKRPVIDHTDLKGRYDFYLDFEFAISAPKQTEGGLLSGGDEGPDLFAAVVSQLGLRLVPDKSAVEMLVIDKLERTPTPN